MPWDRKLGRLPQAFDPIVKYTDFPASRGRLRSATDREGYAFVNFEGMKSEFHSRGSQHMTK
jgi:hypothetical protein